MAFGTKIGLKMAFAEKMNGLCDTTRSGRRRKGKIGEEFFIPYRCRRETKNFSPSLIDCLILIKLNNGFSFDCRANSNKSQLAFPKDHGAPAFITGASAAAAAIRVHS